MISFSDFFSFNELISFIELINILLLMISYFYLNKIVSIFRFSPEVLWFIHLTRPIQVFYPGFLASRNLDWSDLIVTFPLLFILMGRHEPSYSSLIGSFQWNPHHCLAAVDASVAFWFFSPGFLFNQSSALFLSLRLKS